MCNNPTSSDPKKPTEGSQQREGQQSGEAGGSFPFREKMREFMAQKDCGGMMQEMQEMMASCGCGQKRSSETSSENASPEQDGAKPCC